MTAPTTGAFRVVCHQNHGGKGTVAVIHADAKGFRASAIPAGAATGLPFERRPTFVGLDKSGAVVLLDPVSKRLNAQAALPVDALPTYAYTDQSTGRMWFVNDGDEETGNDSFNCGDKGSSVTILQNAQAPKVFKTLCVGRGHHVTAFVGQPHGKKIVFVSDLNDGTIHIVGNDEQDSATFLNILGSINLCEPEKEESKSDQIPNNAFPHGMVFSPVSGKVYNLNNGYGTIAVMDPASFKITNRIALKGCSNLLLSPNGKFLVGKGADRKADPDHVIGKIAVVDVSREEVVTLLDLKDVYPSTFRFNPSGTKLYVTTAATGKGAQRGALKMSTLLVFDATALPKLALLKEVNVGKADCGRRPIAFRKIDSTRSHIFVPNPTDGTLTILDDGSDRVVDTVRIGDGNCDEVLFSFWDGDVFGS